MKPSIPKAYKPLDAKRYTELQVEGLMNDYELYGEGGNAAYYNNVVFGGYFPYTPEGMKDMMYAYLETDGKTNTNWFDEVTRVGSFRNTILIYREGAIRKRLLSSIRLSTILIIKHW